MSEDWSKAIFREEAEELLAELESTLLELEEQTEDANLVNRVFRALHTIKGSGAMFGFDEIADFAHEVETLFDRVRGGELVVTRAVLDVSFKARDHIKNLLANALPEEEKQVVVAAIKQEIIDAAAGATAKQPTLVSDPQPEPESYVAVDQETAQQVEPEEESEDFVLLGGPESIPEEPTHDVFVAPSERCTYHIDIRSRAGGLPDGYPLDPLFAELEQMGEVEVVRIEEPNGKDRWEVSVVTERDEDEVRDVFFFADVDLDVTISCSGVQPDEELVDVPAQVSTEEEGSASEVLGISLSLDDDEQDSKKSSKLKQHIPVPQDKVAEPSAVQGIPVRTAVQVKPATECAMAPAERPLPEKATSLRVAASKLDKLVDLVGELVIIQSQLSQHALDKNDAPLIMLSEGLDRLVEELRDTTLGVRMVPIGTTFSKFRRLVRDLNTELGKDVEFIPIGAATELDKTVIERLSDPLVHLLRNAMDHGIESPEERARAGKPGKGTIRLSAEHSGGEVLIQMVDDGHGIDAQEVLVKAQQAGLVEPGADLTQREIFRLLFAPGFSTAQEITSLSGRGVGLDVVQQGIEALRGSIAVESEVGEGTTFSIRLPLTLAIIDGLQVRSEDETYVIPLTQVEECVELFERDRREQDGSRILDLRGEIVPYVNLREWFEIPGIRPAIEQVVITTVDKRRIGIVVDDVVGEYQTVIKTLGRVYRDVEGISGATVRGDGSIALILDIPGLVRSVTEEALRGSA